MRQLRVWMVAIIAWLCLLYGMEKTIQSFDIAFVLFNVAFSLLILLWHSMRQVDLSHLLTVGLLSYSAWVILVMGTAISTNWGSISLEFILLICTIFLNWQLSRALELFEGAVSDTSLSISMRKIQKRATDTLSQPISAKHLYKTLSIRTTEKNIRPPLNPLIRDLAQDLTQQYIMAHITRVLRSVLKRSGILVQRNDHFLLLLPNQEASDASCIGAHLAWALKQELGIKVDMGYSAFPEDTITFIEMLEKAETRQHPVNITQNGTGSNGYDNQKLMHNCLQSALLNFEKRLEDCLAWQEYVSSQSAKIDPDDQYDEDEFEEIVFELSESIMVIKRDMRKLETDF